jgi:hypothetical protein
MVYVIKILLTGCSKTPDDEQRNCPKHVEFYSKNKSEKLVHLVGFIIRTVGDVSACFIYKSVFQMPTINAARKTRVTSLLKDRSCGFG